MLTPRHRTHPPHRRAVRVHTLPRGTVVRLESGALAWVETATLRPRAMFRHGRTRAMDRDELVEPVKYPAELAAEFVERHA